MKLLLKIFRHALEDEDNRLLMASSPVVSSPRLHRIIFYRI